MIVAPVIAPSIKEIISAKVAQVVKFNPVTLITAPPSIAILKLPSVIACKVFTTTSSLNSALFK